jgi:hypothetical protein
MPGGIGADGKLARTGSGVVSKTENETSIPSKETENIRVTENENKVVSAASFAESTNCYNWEDRLRKLSTSSSLSCKQWKEGAACKNTAKNKLATVCIKKLGTWDYEECIQFFRKAVVNDKTAPQYYYKKHPVLKRFTPKRTQDKESLPNSLWDTVFILPKDLPDTEALFANKSAICALNKNIPRALFQKKLNLFDIQSKSPEISDEEIFFALDQNPAAKDLLISIYGENFKDRVKEMSEFNLSCNQLIKLIVNDIRQLHLAKNEVKKALITQIIGNEDPIGEITWDDLREAMAGFNLEMSFRNHNAFASYHSAREDSKKFLPFNYGFINKLRKFEKRGCENGKIKPRETAKAN